MNGASLSALIQKRKNTQEGRKEGRKEGREVAAAYSQHPV
jgi:hypothetical protein